MGEGQTDIVKAEFVSKQLLMPNPSKSRLYVIGSVLLLVSILWLLAIKISLALVANIDNLYLLNPGDWAAYDMLKQFRPNLERLNHSAWIYLVLSVIGLAFDIRFLYLQKGLKAIICLVSSSAWTTYAVFESITHVSRAMFDYPLGWYILFFLLVVRILPEKVSVFPVTISRNYTLLEYLSSYIRVWVFLSIILMLFGVCEFVIRWQYLKYHFVPANIFSSVIVIMVSATFFSLLLACVVYSIILVFSFFNKDHFLAGVLSSVVTVAIIIFTVYKLFSAEITRFHMQPHYIMISLLCLFALVEMNIFTFSVLGSEVRPFFFFAIVFAPVPLFLLAAVSRRNGHNNFFQKYTSILVTINFLLLLGLLGFATYRCFFDYSFHLRLFTALATLVLLVFAFLSYRKSYSFITLNRLQLIRIPAVAFLGVIVWSCLNSFPLNQKAMFFLQKKCEFTKVLIKISRLMTDFDRDHYSSFLDGGDVDNFNRDINPERCYFIGYTPPGATPAYLQKITPASCQTKTYRNPPILIITFEALRYDVFRKNGWPTALTPNLNRFADRNLSFTNYYAGGNSTGLAIVSLLSGDYSSRNYSKQYQSCLLPQMLENTGRYHVFLVSGSASSVIKRVAGKWLSESSSKFIDLDKYADGSSKDVLRLSLQYLDKYKDEGFFMQVHLPEAHFPYIEGSELKTGTSRERYDNCISIMDKAFGEFMNGLQQLNFKEKPIIFITGDHGEEFNDHGFNYHGIHLYNESIQIPLVVSLPWQPSGQISSLAVAQDIVPTIFSLLGVDTEQKFHGRSLIPAIQGHPLPERLVFVMSSHRDELALIDTHGMKMIYDRKLNLFELYDLNKDSLERINIIESNDQSTSALKTNIYDFLWFGRGHWGDPEVF